MIYGGPLPVNYWSRSLLKNIFLKILAFRTLRACQPGRRFFAGAIYLSCRFKNTIIRLFASVPAMLMFDCFEEGVHLSGRPQVMNPL